MSLQQCCFNSGSARKIGKGAVFSGRVGTFQSLAQVQNIAAYFQCVTVHYRLAHSHQLLTLACTQYVLHICAKAGVYVLRWVCVWASTLLYKLVFIRFS